MKQAGVSLGEVFAFPVRGGWGACQVVALRPRETEVIPLQFFSDARPSLADVPTTPLYTRHHWNDDAPPGFVAVDAVPERFVSLGVAPVTFARAAPVCIYAFWENLPTTVWAQRRWDAAPRSARDAFMRHRDDLSPVTLALPGVPAKHSTLPARTHTLFLDLDARPPTPGWITLPDPAALDWRVFDALPCLTSVEVHGDHPGLVEWLRSRPLVAKLTWRGARGARVDLRSTRLLDLFVEPRDAELELVLPDEFERLGLAIDGRSRVAAVHADDGRGVRLSFETWEGDGLARFEGLTHASELDIRAFRRLDLAPLAGRWNPTTLRLTGAPGVLHHAAALASFAALEEAWILQCVSVDADQFPPVSSWPRLKFMRFHDLARVEVDALRKRLGKDRRLAFRAPRDPDWVFANAGHPMLRWPHSPKRVAAAGAFTLAARKLATAATDAAALKALRNFAGAMDKLHAAPATRLSADEARDADGAWSILLSRTTAGVVAEAEPLARPAWRGALP